MACDDMCELWAGHLRLEHHSIEPLAPFNPAIRSLGCA